MSFGSYIHELQSILEQIINTQAANIHRAGLLVADAIAAGGLVHTFGTGHSRLIAEEAFFRAGGIAAVNPILDESLFFQHGALASTRAEREPGLAARLLNQVEVRSGDAAILVSNSGCNAAPIEMALEMSARGANVIAITSINHSRAIQPRHASGKRLFELATVAIDNCVPTGDALMRLPGLTTKIGPASTAAGTAIIHSLIIEAAEELISRGIAVPVFPSANTAGVTEQALGEVMRPYRARIPYLDV